MHYRQAQQSIRWLQKLVEKAMRQSLAESTLANVAEAFHAKAPEPFLGQVGDWFDERGKNRRARVRPLS